MVHPDTRTAIRCTAQTRGSENETISCCSPANMSKDHWQICGCLMMVTKLVSGATKSHLVFPLLSIPLLNHICMAYQCTVPAREAAEGSREQKKIGTKHEISLSKSLKIKSVCLLHCNLVSYSSGKLILHIVNKLTYTKDYLAKLSSPKFLRGLENLPEKSTLFFQGDSLRGIYKSIIDKNFLWQP